MRKLPLLVTDLEQDLEEIPSRYRARENLYGLEVTNHGRPWCMPTIRSPQGSKFLGEWGCICALEELGTGAIGGVPLEEWTRRFGPGWQLEWEVVFPESQVRLALEAAPLPVVHEGREVGSIWLPDVPLGPINPDATPALPPLLGRRCQRLALPTGEPATPEGRAAYWAGRWWWAIEIQGETYGPYPVDSPEEPLGWREPTIGGVPAWRVLAVHSPRHWRLRAKPGHSPRYVVDLEACEAWVDHPWWGSLPWDREPPPPQWQASREIKIYARYGVRVLIDEIRGR